MILDGAIVQRGTTGLRKMQSLRAPIAIGLALNLSAIEVGNPYIMALVGLVIALVALIFWSDAHFLLIVLISVVAANPVNQFDFVGLNLVFIIVFLYPTVRQFGKLPLWLLIVDLFAIGSVLLSTSTWVLQASTKQAAVQLVAIINYVLGPFLLIPLMFSHLQKERSSLLLLKGLLFGLLLPTVLTLLLVRGIGHGDFEGARDQFGYAVNISYYTLGNIEFSMIRTQVGIVLACLITGSFAVLVVARSRVIRLSSGTCLVGSVYLLMTTGSVGSALAACCGVVGMLIVGRRYFLVRHYLIVGILAAVLTVSWFSLPPGLREYTVSRYDQRFSGGEMDASDRLFLWSYAFNFLLENPSGIGWVPSVKPISYNPHNDYLSYGISFGVICGAMYLIVPTLLLISMWKFKVPKSDWSAIAIVLAGIGLTTAFAVNSFSDHLTANKWYFNVVWSMIWYSYFVGRGLSQRSNNKMLKVESLATPPRRHFVLRVKDR